MATVSLWILVGLGATVVLLGIVAASVGTVDWLRDFRRAAHPRSFGEGAESARNRLANDAWWFSECPEVMELLRDLAAGKDVGDAREKWRKARNVTPPPQH